MIPEVTSAEVLQHRGSRNAVDAFRPYAVVREEEASGDGAPVPVTTLFLTAAECPLRCTMCDLWKNTLPARTPPMAIVQQIRDTLDGTARSGWLKLYNSGSFFDRRSIPEAEYGEIAALCEGFERVIVENHPRFGYRALPRFAKLLNGKLEVAVGLESVQPGMLRRLNKRMTRDDFDRYARRLRSLGVDLRVFLMLRPPWTGESEAVRWALLSVKHAIACGARHVSIIPARAGNGWMDEARRRGDFHPPSAISLERSMESALRLVRELSSRTVVTVDLWDWDRLADCPACSGPRHDRLQAMNLEQCLSPPVQCDQCHEQLP